MTPGRSLRGWKGYSRTAALCHPMGGLPQLGVAGQAREGCRSTIELRFSSIFDEGKACQAKKGVVQRHLGDSNPLGSNKIPTENH